MTAYPTYINIYQSFVQFRNMDPEIEMKRAKRDYTYIHRDQPSHRISVRC